MVTINEHTITIQMKGGPDELDGTIRSLLMAVASMNEDTILNTTELFHIMNLVSAMIPDLANPKLKLPKEEA
ncbi:MAG: hypothetical protein LCH54_15665 [Bacteroidetes bacterium]|nr:hypothetical protein [Bacteroidota bacterium]